MSRLKTRISRAIKNMPKYTINDEAFENQALARSRAFGRDRSVQMQEANIEQGAADSAYDASKVTGSTSSLLSTIAAINANKTTGLRGLAQQEAEIKRQNVGELYGANQAMIDEKDKAWNQNVYAPWAAHLQNLKERKANRDAKWGSIAGGLLSAGATILGGPIGGAVAGSMLGAGNSFRGQPTVGMEEDMYGANTRYS